MLAAAFRAPALVASAGLHAAALGVAVSLGTAPDISSGRQDVLTVSLDPAVAAELARAFAGEPMAAEPPEATLAPAEDAHAVPPEATAAPASQRGKSALAQADQGDAPPRRLPSPPIVAAVAMATAGLAPVAEDDGLVPPASNSTVPELAAVPVLPAAAPPAETPEPPRTSVALAVSARPLPRNDSEVVEPREAPVRAAPQVSRAAADASSAATVASAPAAAAPAAAALGDRWAAGVARAVDRAKRPPARAGLARGRSVIAVTLSAEGRVMDLRLAASSGASLLDDAALAAARGAAFPPAPKGYPARSQAFRIPVVFR